MPEHLIEEIISGNCMLFVGSGISKKCVTEGRKSLPNWYEFLKEFIVWVQKSKNLDDTYCEDLLQLLDERKYLIVAEELLENINHKEFGEFLQRTFNSKNIVPSRLHKLIAMLPFRGIITTNYDNLIEVCIVKEKSKIPKVFTNNDILNGLSPLENDFFILKMHGDIEDPESIVLSYKSYLKMMFDSLTYQELIEKIFSEYTVLFIGYGGSDNNVEFLLDRLAIRETKSKHYLLSKENTFMEIEKNHYKKDRKLEIIEYIDYFGLHNHIDTFFVDIITKLTEKGALLNAIPKELRAVISVFYDDNDFLDGIFLHQYFFKEGAITRVGKAQLEQSSYFINASMEDLCRVGFLLLYFGNLDFKHSKYIAKVNDILNNKSSKYKCKIILISLEKNKEYMNAEYQNETIFFINNEFIDSDLEGLKNYLIDQV